uniref:NADH-ubiquinone oxidoreductase chain 4L n=1 Tax=Nuttallina californica TaxID=413430 RepID=A0A0E3DE42_9MOLL|nr:NADH dehydrogenase subunit 4L [Nuttallina californica]AIA77071.1 NADH dehydrogenase subunit 4L [Nuttallina californica]
MIGFFNPFLYLSALGGMMSLLALCFQRKHLLNSLFCLELLMLSLVGQFFFFSDAVVGEGIVLYMYLTMVASEASLGLSLLVILVCFHGNDYVSSLSLNKC